jgi:hypothetical protein
MAKINKLAAAMLFTADGSTTREDILKGEFIRKTKEELEKRKKEVIAKCQKDGTDPEPILKGLDFNTGSSIFADPNFTLNPLASTSLDSIMREFNVNGYLTPTLANEMYSTIRENLSDVDRLFTFKSATLGKLYHVKVEAAMGRRLISRTRNPNMGDNFRKDLFSVMGFDIKTEEVELDTDIELDLIASQIYQEDFMGNINRVSATLKANDISELLTLGRGTSAQGLANTDPDSAYWQLMRGYQHLLKWLDGDITFSNEVKSVFGEFGYWMSPYRVNVKKINSDLSTWTGANTQTLMREMRKTVDTRDLDKSSMYYIMSQDMYDEYMEYRSIIGVDTGAYGYGVNNTTRENYVQNGFVPMLDGYMIMVNKHASHVKDGGMVVFGDLREFLVIDNPAGVKMNMFFNARNNGGTWEKTDIFQYGTGIRNKRKLVAAFSTYEYSVDGKTANTDEVKTPAIYAVDRRYTNLTAKIALSAVENGKSAYGFCDMHPTRYKIAIGAKDGSETTPAEVIAVDNLQEAGFDFGTLDAGAYNICVYDKNDLLDTTIQVLTVS